MGKFIIKGNRALSGSVEISGSKNAALPLIFASIITCGVSVLHNVPDIGDVNVAVEIISSFGADVVRRGADLIIDTTDLTYSRPSDVLVSRIRASTYLLGANLSRFGTAHIQAFGGCNFDDRPIDMHITAMTLFGAEHSSDVFTVKRLVGADVRFDKMSVGATINAILLAVLAEGSSRIFGYAKEPHVLSLIEFLTSAGADITIFEDRLEIVGKELSGAEATVIADMIEAGTYLSLSLLTASDIKVVGADSAHLSSFFQALSSSGGVFEIGGNYIRAKGEITEPLNIVTGPYPGFPTDLQPQIAPLLARFCGGRITERVWSGRFGYLSELELFGVRCDICESSALIYPSTLRSASAKAIDLRGGAALLMCALFAEGESVIDSAQIIKRGYSDIVYKLKKLGADIAEIN